MAHLTFQQEYMQIPPVTRTYTSACVITTILVQLDIISPFQLYFNPILIFRHYQLWRLFTTFLFFGTIGFNFLFNMIFTYRYCRMLEEGSFRGKTADFVFMILFGGSCMIGFALFCSLLFLGQAFTIMLVYIWARRNPSIRMNFFGLLNFQAPYLPWVLLGFSFLLGNSVLVDLVGMAVGHVYYYFEDVFPSRSGGIRILKTPWIFFIGMVGIYSFLRKPVWLLDEGCWCHAPHIFKRILLPSSFGPFPLIKQIFEPRTEDQQYDTVPADQRPGGFQWGRQNDQ